MYRNGNVKVFIITFRFAHSGECAWGISANTGAASLMARKLPYVLNNMGNDF